MTPRYKDIPEHWQAPMGPYRQAPPEFGGEWWLVSPFTGEEPWRTQGGGIAEPELPPGFLDAFGPRPRIRDFLNEPNPSLALRIATTAWKQALRYFKQAGIPEWTDAVAVAEAVRIFVAWNMREPVFYEGRYGWMARFSRSDVSSFQAPALTAIETPHLIVMRY
ncbi:MAG: hypothetical protein MI861_13495, partial [Pirellulales bacterium]|nr:hypothetical protein [Pirellulales bacterium]